MALNPAGRIEVTTPAGGFTDDRPVAWQEGAGDRTPVQVAYDTSREPGACPERSAGANSATFHLEP